MNQCIFYCINSLEKESVMKDRFKKLGISVNFCNKQTNNSEDNKKDAMTAFLFSGKEYVGVVDGSIHLHRNLSKELQSIVMTMKSLELDFLLLGYYTSEEIEPWHPDFPFITQMGNRRYHYYPFGMKGNLFYIASKSYAEKYLKDKDYLPSKKALVYPMYAIEENSVPIKLNTLFFQECEVDNYFPDQFY